MAKVIKVYMRSLKFIASPTIIRSVASLWSSCPSVGCSVGWSVCINFFKRLSTLLSEYLLNMSAYKQKFYTHLSQVFAINGDCNVKPWNEDNLTRMLLRMLLEKRLN